MKLRRLVDEVQTQIDDAILSSLTGSEPLGDYEVEFGRDVETQGLDDALEKFAGRSLSAADDAEMAIALRATLPLTRREASDRNLWWWLCARRYPALVRQRWSEKKDGDEHLTRERMLGPINRNALARLWWGAELVQKTNHPEKYTKLMFRNQDLYEAVIGRSLGRYPIALGAIIDELSSTAGKPARLTVRDFRYLLSTLVLEAMEPQDIRKELQRIKVRHTS